MELTDTNSPRACPNQIGETNLILSDLKGGAEIKRIISLRSRYCEAVFKLMSNTGKELEREERKKHQALFSFEGEDLQEGNPVVKALRNHLYPYRTQKLSSIASMVLGG